MAKVIVLGACGGIGSVATKALLCTEDVSSLIAADRRKDELDKLVGGLGDSRLVPIEIDVIDSESVVNLLRGAELVVNCVGPFYRFGPALLEMAIEAGVDYVDVCDDLDATIAQIELSDAAAKKGVRALIGMGSSPGLANVLVRYAADNLLDSVESVDISHVHGGEPSEGPAVIKHRIHAMVNDVPVFVDGKTRQVRMLEPSGLEFTGDVDFRDVGTFTVYPYPHPETVTLPTWMPSLKRVTNRGSVFPLDYFALTMSMVRNGIASTEPLRVDGADVVPLEFAVAHIMRERPRLIQQAGVTSPAGCLRIEVEGTKNQQTHRYVFSSGSTQDGAGAGTGIPVALGALLMLRGGINQVGVRPPEAVVDPIQMLAIAGDIVAQLGVGASQSGGNAKVPLHIEHTGPDGSVEELSLDLG